MLTKEQILTMLPEEEKEELKQYIKNYYNLSLKEKEQLYRIIENMITVVMCSDMENPIFYEIP